MLFAVFFRQEDNGSEGSDSMGMDDDEDEDDFDERRPTVITRSKASWRHEQPRTIFAIIVISNPACM